MQKYLKNPILWIDLEMTGLNIKEDFILEFACILTDQTLQQQICGPNCVIQTQETILANMNEWCQNQHQISGLSERCLQSQIKIEDCERLVIEFLIENGIQEKEVIVAGNSVGVDMNFINVHMPKLSAFLHYRVIDVSSIKELCRRWKPDLFNQQPKKKGNHRALDDIQESIHELKFYQDNFFKI